MDRAEALRVMNEMSAELKGRLIPRAVSLGEGCEIRLSCDLDDGTRDILRAFAARQGLSLKESDGTVVIR